MEDGTNSGGADDYMMDADQLPSQHQQWHPTTAGQQGRHGHQRVPQHTWHSVASSLQRDYPATGQYFDPRAQPGFYHQHPQPQLQHTHAPESTSISVAYGHAMECLNTEVLLMGAATTSNQPPLQLRHEELQAQAHGTIERMISELQLSGARNLPITAPSRTSQKWSTLIEALHPLERVFTEFANTKKVEWPHLKKSLEHYFTVRKAESFPEWNEAQIDLAITTAAHNSGLKVIPQFTAPRRALKMRRCCAVLYEHEALLLQLLQDDWKSGRKQVLPPSDMPELKAYWESLARSSKPSTPTKGGAEASDNVFTQATQTSSEKNREQPETSQSATRKSSAELRVTLSSLKKAGRVCYRHGTDSTNGDSEGDKNDGRADILLVTPDGKAAILIEDKYTPVAKLGCAEMALLQCLQYRDAFNAKKDARGAANFPFLEKIFYVGIHVFNQNECRYVAIEYRWNQGERKWKKHGDYIRSDKSVVHAALHAATRTDLAD